MSATQVEPVHVDTLLVEDELSSRRKKDLPKHSSTARVRRRAQALESLAQSAWVVEAPQQALPVGAKLLDFTGRPQATFDNPTLERDFIGYCQMASPIALDPEQFDAKLQELLAQTANHIYQAEFEAAGAAERICGDYLLEPVQNIQEPMMRLPEETKMFATLCTTRLLTPAEEISVLRRLHFLKFLAHKILTSESIDQWSLARAEGLLRAAQWHRTLFVQCNMRLVVSIIRKLPVPTHRYDELFSDGVVGLLRAIDKFDPCRGYRFCTYATTVIRRECFQQIEERKEECEQCVQSAALTVLASVRGISDTCEQTAADRARFGSWQEKLVSLLHRLSRREQVIIRSRYCLGAHREVKTLQRLAAALKISKERVRQLEISALEKLRRFATETPAEEACMSEAS